LSEKAEAAFAASLAAAIAMEPAASGDDDGDVADTSDGAADDSADAGSEGADTDADDGAGEDDDDSSDAGASGSSAAKELFLSGDKAGALKALGLDPKILDLNDAKFRTMRQGLKEADTKLAEATRLHTEATAKQEETKRMYELGKKELGPVLQMKRLLAKGDYASAKDLLEALAPPGTTYRQISEGLAAAASGMSAAEQLYRRKLRELDEQEQKKAEPEPEKKAPASDPNRDLEGARKVLTVHGKDLLDVPGAAEALVRVAREHWDAEKKGFKVPRAKLVELVRKDTVISQLLELKALKAKGVSQSSTAPSASEDDEEEQTTPRDKSGRFRERPRQPPKPKLTPEQQRAADREAKLRKSIAEAAAMEKASQRGKGRR
jgi:uncharacterized membrane-anchored protein YhcB (DUF1043 family)